MSVLTPSQQEQPDDPVCAPASSFSSSSSSSLSPAPSDHDDHYDDSTHKICTRPRCPHNKVPLPLTNFQETNKRGEVITWKHCKDCRTKHAKEDRERKQAKRREAKAMADDNEDGEDGEDDEDDEEKERSGKRLVVTLRASPGALRVLKAGGRIEGEIEETFVDAPTLVLRGGGGGGRSRGGDRRRSLAFAKRVKNEDSDPEWNFQQVQKRRKSLQKGRLGKAKKRSAGDRRRAQDNVELGPEGSVYDSGTNSEEEADKKRGERGAKGTKGGPSG